jgi:5-formyltetrahydrofolate cyclo-ligase
MVVPSTSLPTDKAGLRAELRTRRRAFAASLVPATRTALEDALAAALEPFLFAARTIAAYQPMRDEISPLSALARASALGKETALPAFAERDSRMTFRTGEASVAGPWGLLQPPLTAAPVQPDLVLVPLVGCDPHGNRIGMGQGHYDRALEGLRQHCRLVGIGWDFQLLEIAIRADPWDQKLDAFASPAGVREFRSK